ncbi:3-oxo-5-alpha-steroid 4-dehydrogenase 1 isoform X2 [Salarias fasciatus]|uniref:3-oxo-5alpha-steroid 4-dehydrogenase (NADP(+)) n=1 Tax=Salarias fasciatus TaxID=181472 RepID=A0A672FT11_SALFA|nr:3-oxo-5-alpha-steroid 4-dehydrogenase 1 isoform X2 [Salarias fasciatus]XP_029976782.1 3-oxo-5-alpha-steroid 4-dehydrogenase 1 isoform X2 [Salarias fasciatus]
MEALLSALFSSREHERYTLDCMAYFMFFMAACSFVTFLFEDVPYGRYTTGKYGFPVNARFAWFVQELPAFLLPVGLIFWASSSKTSVLENQLLIAMYMCHYTQRALIYPFLIRGGKPTPFGSFALAFVFCSYNGYMQIRYLSHYAEYPAHWATHPCFIIGSFLWLVGWLVNVHSDHILRNLRKPGETGYKIPRGGVFEYVSGANFLGEITEWTGFAVAGHSIHSAAFAIFTTAVIANRAVAHHKWYLSKFEDYPKNRKALIPFLF